MFDLTKFRRNDETGWMIWLGLMLALWSALVAGSLAWYMHLQQQSVLNNATIAARANINKDQSFRKWAASHGGVYVPPTEHTPPNPYLHVPDRDVVTTTGKSLTLMNPAYMLRQLQSDFPSDYGTRSHITSLKPINPNNAPDAWEAKALHGFGQGGKKLLEAQQIDGQPYLRMMLPLIVEQGCLKCHEQQGYKLGDIRGGISSAVPLAPFLAREREFRDSMILGHGASWLLGLAGLAWLGISFRRVQRLNIRVRSAAAVEESERRFRAIAQSANDAIISADSDGNVVGCNPSSERLFGYTETETIGQPLTMLMPERFRGIHRAGLARAVAGGVPHVIGKTVEFTGRRKDGSEFPLEISMAQWQAADGQFFTAIIRDITARKQAEDNLRASEGRYHQIIQTSMDGFWILDTKGRIRDVNDAYCQLLGYAREEFMNMRITDVEAKETQEDTAQHIQEVMTKGYARFEAQHRRKDGQLLDIEVSTVYQPDTEGGHFFAFLRDITEHKQAEAQLAEQLDELRRWHNATSGREARILELKHEMNELLAQSGQPPRYPSAE